MTKAESRSDRATLKRRQATVPTSPLAMGKALVLLATSCAALTSHSIPAGRAGGGSSHRAIQRRGAPRHRRDEGNDAFQTTVALYYRDGDHDQSVEMRAANDSAVHSAAGRVDTAATPTAAARPRQSMTPLTGLFHLPALTLAPAPRSKEDEEHDAMDEYIEFYERRYSRMHPELGHQHKKAPSKPKAMLDMHLPRKIFMSTISFHRTTSLPASQAAKAMTEEDEEDALHVLGLDRLASEKLKHKLHLHVPRDLREEYTTLTSSTEHALHFLTHRICSTSLRAAAATTTASKAAAAKALTAGGRTSTYTSLSFPDQFKLLVTTLHKLTQAFMNTVTILSAFTGRLFSEILEKGGFRHSVRAAGVAAVAVVVMFRPLFRGAMRQG